MSGVLVVMAHEARSVSEVLNDIPMEDDDDLVLEDERLLTWDHEGLNVVEDHFAWGVATPALEEGLHVLERIGHVSIYGEVLEDLDWDSTSGLHLGCSFGSVVLLDHEEPDDLLSLGEELEAQRLIDGLGEAVIG